MIIVFTSGTSVGIFNFQVLEMTNLSRHFLFLSSFTHSHPSIHPYAMALFRMHICARARFAYMRMETERQKERARAYRERVVGASGALTCTRIHIGFDSKWWCERVLEIAHVLNVCLRHVTLPHHQNSIRIDIVFLLILLPASFFAAH